jgi:hypothetical protein
MGLFNADLYSRRVDGRAIITFEIDSTGVTCRLVRASEPAPCCVRQPGDPPNQSGEGDDEKGRPHGPEQAQLSAYGVEPDKNNVMKVKSVCHSLHRRY